MDIVKFVSRQTPNNNQGFEQQVLTANRVNYRKFPKLVAGEAHSNSKAKFIRGMEGNVLVFVFLLARFGYSCSRAISYILYFRYSLGCFIQRSCTFLVLSSIFCSFRSGPLF